MQLIIRRNVEGTNVFAVFKGYLKWDSRKQQWTDDEWLTHIYSSLQDAKEVLWKFADGHPFDDNMENRVTRYFGKRDNPFTRGKELNKGDPGITEQEWMRYSVYTLI